jgi:hypothetical protein
LAKKRQVQRVRLEFTAMLRVDGRVMGFVCDKRLTVLQLMLEERFGHAGAVAFSAWVDKVATRRPNVFGHTYLGKARAATGAKHG